MSSLKNSLFHAALELRSVIESDSMRINNTVKFLYIKHEIKQNNTTPLGFLNLMLLISYISRFSVFRKVFLETFRVSLYLDVFSLKYPLLHAALNENSLVNRF